MHLRRRPYERRFALRDVGALEAHAGDRTQDLLITTEALYLLSYAGKMASEGVAPTSPLCDRGILLLDEPAGYTRKESHLRFQHVTLAPCC